MSLPVELHAVIARRLEAVGLAADLVEDLLESVADDLDAAGITTAAGPGLDGLLARNRVYRNALRQVGHAIDVAQQDGP